jgi:methylmalonyl-CoA/ethylmalonyl-CoA epimerase
MTTPTFGLSQLGQIGVSVRDLAGAVRFYRDTLGLKFLFEVPGRMAFFDLAGVRLMLALPEEPGLHPAASILYFKVADIHAAHEALAGRGGAFEHVPRLVARMSDHELWMASFRDPERNELALMSEVRG